MPPRSGEPAIAVCVLCSRPMKTLDNIDVMRGIACRAGCRSSGFDMR